jgi:putative transposase
MMNKEEIAKQKCGFWKRRFWKHLIRDQQRFARHVDYIHYNPVKHVSVRCSHQWKHSSQSGAQYRVLHAKC